MQSFNFIQTVFFGIHRIMISTGTAAAMPSDSQSVDDAMEFDSQISVNSGSQSSVDASRIIGILGEENIAMFKALTKPDALSNSYRNPIDSNSMPGIIKDTLNYSVTLTEANQSLPSISPSHFWGMALLAHALELEGQGEKTLFGNLLERGLMVGENREGIAAFETANQPTDIKSHQLIITKKLFIEFLQIHGIYFRLALENGRKDLLIGSSHTMCIPLCREMCTLPEIENSENGVPYFDFENVIMYCSPFLIHDVDSDVKMTLLTLIGMLPNGKHVIAADCEDWPTDGRFERVLEIIKLKGSKLSGITGLNECHKLILSFEVRKKIKYEGNRPLHLSFVLREDSQGLCKFIEAVRPENINISVISSLANSVFFTKLKNIIKSSTIVNDISISNLESFRCNNDGKFLEEFISSEIMSKINQISYVDDINGSDPFYINVLKLHYFELPSSKLKFVFANTNIGENRIYRLGSKYGPIRFARFIGCSEAETVVYRFGLKNHCTICTGDWRQIFVNLLNSKYLKKLVLIFPSIYQNSLLLRSLPVLREMIKETSWCSSINKIVIAVESQCKIPYIINSLGMENCLFNTFYEFYPQEDPRLAQFITANSKCVEFECIMPCTQHPESTRHTSLVPYNSCNRKNVPTV